MEIILLNHFCNPPWVIKIKRTITTSLLKRQVWMANDDEFDRIVKNLQRMLRLNDHYENNLYVEEFKKECNVMFVYETYVLEGEVDSKFSLGDIWNLFQEDTLPNNTSNFSKQIINCMKAWIYRQKTSGLTLNTKVIKQAHGLMMDYEKNVLVGEYAKSPLFVGHDIFAPASHGERYMEDVYF